MCLGYWPLQGSGPPKTALSTNLTISGTPAHGPQAMGFELATFWPRVLYNTRYTMTAFFPCKGGFSGLHPPFWSEFFLPKKAILCQFLGLQPFPDRMMDKSTCSNERLQPPFKKSRSAFAFFHNVPASATVYYMKSNSVIVSDKWPD